VPAATFSRRTSASFLRQQPHCDGRPRRFISRGHIALGVGSIRSIHIAPGDGVVLSAVAFVTPDMLMA
jgi:hypothetical protein